MVGRRSLDSYDIVPDGMRTYLSNYGFHFSKKACEYAVKQMRRDGKHEHEYSVEDVDSLLKKHGVELENDVLYDKVFVANMAYYDYLNKSLTGECHVAKFVKDYLDDEDGCGEEAFRRWIADCVGRGIPVSWEDML